jgi:NDP-sugar pyrophosphorylase family protein
MMQAMIFAAGLGTRLKPLTDTMPKALVSVGGEPLLKRVIHNLSMALVKKLTSLLVFLLSKVKSKKLLLTTIKKN